MTALLALHCYATEEITAVSRLSEAFLLDLGWIAKRALLRMLPSHLSGTLSRAVNGAFCCNTEDTDFRYIPNRRSNSLWLTFYSLSAKNISCVLADGKAHKSNYRKVIVNSFSLTYWYECYDPACNKMRITRRKQKITHFKIDKK